MRRHFLWVVFGCLPLLACAEEIATSAGRERAPTTSTERTKESPDASSATPSKAPAPTSDGGQPSTGESEPLDAGTGSGPADSSAPGPVPAADPVFATAAPYVSGAPTDRAGAHHFRRNPAGQDCLSCHQGSPFVPRFSFGGTVSPAAAGIEVRVVTAGGTAIGVTFTDTDGNFWLAGDAVLSAGARVGIRDATRSRVMAAPLTAGGCAAASCHGTTLPIALP